jgi:hypothetical protein
MPITHADTLPLLAGPRAPDPQLQG